MQTDITTPTSNEHTHAPRKAVYSARDHLIAAVSLAVGEVLYLQDTALPKTKTLALGEDFEFHPPAAGRRKVAGEQPFTSRIDISLCARLVAKKPLAMAVHDPWEAVDGKVHGGVTIGHIRLARSFCGAPQIAGPSGKINTEAFRLRDAARAAGKPEHITRGGPWGALVYDDEIAVPAFWYQEGVSDSKDFSFIIDAREVENLNHQAFQTNRAKKIAEAGHTPRVQAKVVGELKSIQVGKIRWTVDGACVLHRLEIREIRDDGREVYTNRVIMEICKGVVARIGEPIRSNSLRALLGFPPYERTETATPARPARQMPAKADVPAAAPKAVPKAVRRAAAPKLSDVAADISEPLQVEPAESPVEGCAVDVDTAPEAETITDHHASYEIDVVTPSESPEGGMIVIPVQDAGADENAERRARIDLLVEQFQGNECPVVLYDDGSPVVATPGPFSRQHAEALVSAAETGRCLLPSPENMAVLEAVLELV